jgi:hypothetical protein
MPIETVPGTDLTYFLIAYDAAGRERTDDPDGLMSQRAVETLAAEPITDIFIFSHGWQGDVPAAREQYNRWIATMMADSAGLERMRQARPGFRPLMIGFHWPSLPWGDESLGGAVSFGGPAAATAAPPIAALVDEYAGRFADTPATRAALETIFTTALVDPMPPTLPPEVRQAYEVLDRESGLGSDGPTAAPGDDREPFDPESSYQQAADEEGVSFGGFSLGGLLAPLRLLSFFKMKDRARAIGESGGHALLRQLQQASPEAHFHLMGHSFGTGVVSGILGGPGARGALVRPVDSVVLVQGAISFWSYCSAVPFAPGEPGYFQSIAAERKVRGPILTTRTAFDTAVGRIYPLAAGLAGQISYAPGELPKYGAIGGYGIQGPGLDLVDLKMLPADQQYGFEPGKVYNLDCNEVIRNGPPPVGAHGDFLQPQVANAVWEAART